MKDLFRERDFTRIGYFQSVLENEGIRTLIRNERLNTCGPGRTGNPGIVPKLGGSSVTTSR